MEPPNRSKEAKPITPSRPQLTSDPHASTPCLTDIALWADEARATATHYAANHATHGETLGALGWGSRASQNERFAALADIATLDDASLLDFGCGFGDFYGWLLERGFRGRYTGVDITQPMADAAARRYADATFRCAGLDDAAPPLSVDYAFASGIFTYCKHAPYRYLVHVAKRLLATARLGVALNSLSSWGAEPDEHECQLDPARAVTALRSLDVGLTLRHDYLPHDFTVYLRKR